MKFITHTLWLVAMGLIVFHTPLQSQIREKSQQVTTSLSCDHPPVIICPGEFQACPGVSTDPTNTGFAMGLPPNPFCSPPLISYRDSILSLGGCPGSVSLIRIWTATDPQDPALSAHCTQKILLSDTLPPEFFDCPAPITVTPNNGCSANVSWHQPMVMDNCGGLVLTCSHISGDKFPLGQTTVTYTATDHCGNVSTCSFVITVTGDCCDLPPTIICPGDYTGCPGDSIDPKKIGRPTALPGRPHCTQPAVHYFDDTISTGPCNGGLIIDRMWIAVDPNDPTLYTTCTQQITLEDDILPFIFGCPQDIIVDSDDQCKAVVSWNPPTARDNCQGVRLESNYNPGDTFPVGTTTVIYVATDSCGNQKPCSFTVTVNKKCCTDNPEITCPTAYTGCPGESIDPSVTGMAVAHAGGPFCEDPILRYEDALVSEGPCNGQKVIKRLWIAEDPKNTAIRSTCVQTITLQDTTPPTVIGCVHDTLLDPNVNCRAVVLWTPPVFNDHCQISNISSTHSPGDTFDIGSTTVKYTAEDACGNSVMCSFVVTVTDNCCNKPPVVDCPTDYTGCPKDNIHPDHTGMPSITKGHPSCADPILKYSDKVLSTGPCNGQTSIERTWTATDPNDSTLSASCIQKIVLKDDERPVPIKVQKDTTISPNDDCIATLNWDVQFMDNCELVLVRSNYMPGDTFLIGNTMVRYIAIDGCGNDTSISFVVTVLDDCCNEPPVIACPMDFSGCPGSDISPDYTGRPSVTKGSIHCENPIVTFSDDTIGTGQCANSVLIERTWTATDPNDSSLNASCTQTISLDDTEPPVISHCPSDTTLSPNVDCRAIVAWQRPGVSDNCGIASVTSTHMPGDTFDIGATSVIYTLTDHCGHTATCSFVITVLDDCCNEPPVIACPMDFNACPGTSTEPSVTGQASASKGHPRCDDPIIGYSDKVLSSGPCIGAAVIERTWTATDPNDSSLTDHCIQIITLEDNQDPVISHCPGDTTLSPNVDCEALVSWIAPSASDNCGTPQLVSSHNPGDLFPIGQTTVTYTATDGCGHTATCSFVITVLDDCCNEPPVIACPMDFNACPGTSTEPSVTGQASASKGHPRCDDPIIGYSDKVLSSGPCLGATVLERTWTATDPNDSSLTDHCIQIITLEDNQDPVISHCPGDTTLSPNVDCEALVSWIAPSASDNCGTPQLVSSHNPGDLFPIGQTTVTYTATDGCGHTTTCSFVITVLDDCCNKPPVIACPMDFNACPGTSTEPSVTGQASASKGHPRCDDPIIGYSDKVLSSGPCIGAAVIERTWTATDPNDSSLTDHCIQIITLEDNQDPVISHCPGDTTLSPNVDCEALVSWIAPSASDNCGTPQLVSSHNPGDLFPIGQTTVTYTATDGCGHTATCSFVITVLDDCCNKPPVIACPMDFNACPGTSTEPSVTGQASASKGHPRCDDPIIGYSDKVLSSGPCIGAAVIERTWTATDPNDSTLTDHCIQILTLEDNLSPTFTNCPADINAMSDETCKATATWLPPTFHDNCDSLVVTSTHNPGDTFDIGTTAVTYTATDGCGHTTTCSFVVTVTGQNLHIMCPGDIEINNPMYNYGDYVLWSPPTVVQCNPTCPDSLDGFMYMGEWKGHRYFCSNFRADWKNAKTICESMGGHLAVINSKAENDHLSGLLMGQPAYIGLNDFAKEGDFVWVNGDPLTFTSWATGQPDNKNNYQDAVELYPDGTWKDQFYYVNNEFILEIPCFTIEQIEGPENGGFFTCGTTTVTYVAKDNLGASDTCSFDVTVDCSSHKPYCWASGRNSDNYWIQSVQAGDFAKTTGNDGGYGDYRTECIAMTAGQTEDLCIGVGYGGATRNVYWKVWIDFNKDQDFDDNGELMASGFGNTVDCEQIKLPQNVNVRTTLRIGMSYGSWPKSCGYVNQGEYEDYCVIITEQPIWLEKKSDAVEKSRSADAPDRVFDNDLVLYPNPAYDQITLEWKGQWPVNTQIIDTYGRVLETLNVRALKGRAEVNVARWPKGQYVIISQYSDGTHDIKHFIIQE